MRKSLLSFALSFILIAGCATVDTPIIPIVQAAHQPATEYHVDVSDKIPTDAKCNSGDADVFVIDTDAKFVDANLNNATYDYFCVTPGVDAGNINLTLDGTSDTPRVIRYWDNGAVETHPVNMDAADRVTIDDIDVEADYWIIDRMHVHGTADNSINNGAGACGDNFHLQRSLVENSGGGAGQINLGCTDTVIQDNVIRNSKQTTNDDHGVNVANGDGAVIVGNEIYDNTGDNLQHHGQPTNGTIIAYNEFGATSAIWTDCAGTINGTGDCIAMENHLDFKTGSAGTHPYDDTEKVLIIGNTFWGLDRADDAAFVSGGGGEESIIIQQTVEGIEFRDNFMTSGRTDDSTVAIVFTNPDSSSSIEKNTFINNLFYQFNYVWSAFLNTQNNEVYYNTYSDITDLFLGNEDATDHMCNVLIDVVDINIASLGTGTTSEDNAFYNSDESPFKVASEVDEALAATSANSAFSWVKHHISNPTYQSVSLAVTTGNSPHFTTCTDPTETSNYGIDNTDKLDRTSAGFRLTSGKNPLHFRMMGR